ncbi:PREDICTED: sodium/nucleoside cotransporter 1-like [Branchiostoma belcheri]|uniref:Sodium/nucleoside cotransporter n=1 Tax=Branchiostoma belcheri TaxID=7741 RepID=A0A6P4ZA01_BRABE|nr:PREDICTED: sodium/nucleoside cotransporter 1-like [Branchiostoma belcheri]
MEGKFQRRSSGKDVSAHSYQNPALSTEDIAMEPTKRDPERGVNDNVVDRLNSSLPSSDPPSYHEDDIDGEEEEEEEEEDQSRCMKGVSMISEGIGNFVKKHNVVIWRVVYAVLGLGYLAFLIAACVINFCRAFALLIITLVVLVFVVYGLIRDKWGKTIYKSCLKPASGGVMKVWKYAKWVIYLGILVGIGLFLGLETGKQPDQLISLVGYLGIILCLFIFSKSPGKVKWRPVLWGLSLQFLLGLFVLRTSVGYDVFKFLGDKFQGFLAFTDDGTSFVFGTNLVVMSNTANLSEVTSFADLTVTPAYLVHNFVFQVLPTIIFFSTVMSLLYYVGFMQIVINKLAWIMQFTLGTSGPESISAAGNIFVGQTEAPLLVRPFLPSMTKSELHAVMTGGFGTVAGGVLGAFISFGINPSHLLACTVMAAPTALAMSKLVYPEIERKRTKKDDRLQVETSQERNIIEAAASGACVAVTLVANIVGNLIAFIALLGFLNTVLSWLGGMVDIPNLTFETICSYVFMPLAYVMGVPWEDCPVVAELLGKKIFINEFVAYLELADIVAAKKISARSEAIATYALCGFANFSSIGIQLGGLGPMAPNRKGDLAELALRAMITGVLVSVLNACMAGLLYQEAAITVLPTAAANTTLGYLTTPAPPVCAYAGTLLDCMC